MKSSETKARLRLANNEVIRLRAALEQIASIFVESTAGVLAERALMTEEQRQAFDAARAAPSGSEESR